MKHSEATPIVREAWRKVWLREGTPNEILYSQAIAAFETGYGRLGQFGELAKQGKYNWGAEQKPINSDGTCPTGFAKGIDQGKVCFYVFPNDIEAASAFLRTLTKSSMRPDVVSSMKGTPEDVAKAMRGINPPKTSYYAGLPNLTEEQKIAQYANGIRSQAKAIANSLKEAPLYPPNPVRKNDWFYPTLILAMTGAAWVVIPKGKK